MLAIKHILHKMASIKAPLITLSSLEFIKPADLADNLKQPSTSSNVAVIDVRDNDHIGGHVKSSHWVPINQLDARMPELLRINKDKDRVVFHCMLSQQRGPKAALAYARARAYEVEKGRVEKVDMEVSDSKAHGNGSGKDSEWEDVKDDRDKDIFDGQVVCVLEGGFGNWQAFYGEDETLTENYQKDLWI